MRFALYKYGRSPLQRLICWFTRSVYHHVAIQFLDGVVFEAVGRGVVQSESLVQRHEHGVTIDLFEFVKPLTAAQVTEARRLLESCRDHYDVPGLIGFVVHSNRDLGGEHRKFCSKLGQWVCQKIGREIVARTPDFMVSPDDYKRSTALEWVGSMDHYEKKIVVPVTSGCAD